jgi:D-alanyl-lipoteichoic acid acyltransferase DltB (MBOAT superfamily)
VDVHAGKVVERNPIHYALFVTYFPHLIAGPVLHHAEMMPQFRTAKIYRPFLRNFVIGLAFLLMGLAKKVLIADSIAPVANMVFGAGADVPLTAGAAWLGVTAYTLQIYFDFSGYSDMAIGIARLFGIRLPANFDSPLRASSIIDYWLRWHITLSRFLTAYIYNPLLLRLTRARIASGKPALGGKNATFSAFLTLLAFPTIVTMAVSGLWHGAGYTFIVWGLLHGAFLTVNHGWRLLKAKRSKTPVRHDQPGGFWSWLLTFVCVVVAMVFFRAPTMHGAWGILTGIVGGNGIGFPASIFDHLGPLAKLLATTGGTAETWWGAIDFFMLVAWTASLLALALLFPNSAQILARYEPALGLRSSAVQGRLARLVWTPSLKWAIAVAVVAYAAILRLGGPSEFLYWQF